MSVLLALETATRDVSVALLRGGELVAEERAPEDAPTSETLLPAVDALLSAAGLGPDAIEAFAVSIGPGSFTGLRIGIATVKGLAFGSVRPVAPVRTLAALSRAAGPVAEPVVAVLDARRGELYAGAFLRGGLEVHPALPEGIYEPADLLARLPAAGVMVGEGVALLGDRPGWRRIPPPEGAPRARHVATLGAELLAGGKGIDAAALVPWYGRRAEAEVRRTGVAGEVPPHS